MKNIPGFSAEVAILEQRNHTAFSTVIYAGAASDATANGLVQPAQLTYCRWRSGLLYCCSGGVCWIAGSSFI